MKQRKSHALLLFIILSLCQVGYAQVAFSKIYGGADYDYGYAVTQTSDKGYAVTGSTTSFGNGISDAYILKTDSMGVAKWHKTYGGINIDQTYSIIETGDSGLVIAGYTNSFGSGGYDMFVIKTDSYGNTIWEKTYGGSNWDFAYSIEQTTDGGYIIAGGTYSFGAGDEDMYLVKINGLGDTLWTRTYGGIYEDEIRKVKQTADGGYIVTGSTKSFGDLNGDIYTLKLDPSGDSLWAHRYDGGKEDRCNDVIENIYGGYILGGKSKLFTGNNFNGIVIEISAMGIQNSIDTIFGGTASNDMITSIKQSPGGRLARAGTTYSWGWGLGDFMLHIWNPYNGWHLPTMGGYKAETGYCLNTTKDGGYIFCGSSASYSYLSHIFLVKTDSNGLAPTTVSSITIGMRENKADDLLINVYPIPASNELFLEINNQQVEQTSICLRDLLGRIIYEVENNNSDNRFYINTSNILSGIYFISIKNKDIVSTKRIIIQH